MTSGFGVDRSADGLNGTTSQDIRRINGGLYSPGIINGSVVATSATTRNYTVSSGVVAIKTADGEIVLAPIAAGTITGPAAPTSGTRSDIVYAQQQYPSLDGGSASIVFGVATVLPPRAVTLAQYLVAAGNTTSSQYILQASPNYSIPYGGSLGELHYWQMKNSVILADGIVRYGHKEINLPTDRLVSWTIHANMSGGRPDGSGAAGFDNAAYCEYGFLPNYDSGDWTLWSTGGLHQAWETFQYQNTIPMSAGKHTVNFGVFRIVGPGRGATHYGVDPAGFGRRGIEFRLVDEGPVV